MEKENRSNISKLNILISKVIYMTIFSNDDIQNNTPLTYKDYMKLRREKIRDRRMRTGSFISGQILSLKPPNKLVELYPAVIDMAI